MLALHILVKEVRRLASHGVVNSVKTRLIRHRVDDRLHAVLELLIVHTRLRRQRGGGHLLLTIQMHPPELRRGGSDIHELLLKLLLPLGEIEVRRHKIAVSLRVHLSMFLHPKAHGRRGKDLLRRRVHLAAVVAVVLHIPITAKACGGGRLRCFLSPMRVVVETVMSLVIGSRSGGSLGGQSWGGAQAGK